MRTISVIVGFAMIIALQVIILQRMDDSQEDLAAARASVTELRVELSGVGDRIDDVAAQVESLELVASVDGATPAPGAGGVAGVAPGALPTFTSPQNDPAVLDGYVLGALSATEYYSDTALSIAPDDGKPRVWLIWAHWCPYCQQELPELAQWWPQNADRFPNTELVTVTTSMNESRGNPLTPYLEASQFPFPVLVDPNLEIATQFGTSAFPFWVVTDGAGRVVFRVAGAVGIDAIEAIFTQVESLATGT